MKIAITVNGRDHRLEVSPLRRLLDILREELRLTGTKEGCGEGECGACAVLLDGELVNACLVPALQLDGRRIVTVEGLGTREDPDPVQQAFLEEGAVQCGFCIPGMVMAARALLDHHPDPTREEIRTALAGNLCRCTGYERIFRAVERAAASGARRHHGPLATPDGDADEEIQAQERYPIVPTGHRPGGLDDALAVLRAEGEAVTLVAGATDFLTEIQMGRTPPPALLDVTRLTELMRIQRTNGLIEIGAAASFAAIGAHPEVRAHLPALADAARQIGAVAIQNRATLGGNLMTASPAADAPPVLLALDATVELADLDGRRVVALEDFYTGYRQTVRRADELLTRVRVPLPEPDVRQAFYKVGPRLAQSIAKVSLAGRARVDEDGLLQDVRLAAGSMAATVIALPRTEAALEGRRLTRASLADRVREAQVAAQAEVAPIDDVRSTAGYRAATMGALVGRFVRSLAGAQRSDHPL